jgi:hypothetical protein
VPLPRTPTSKQRGRKAKPDDEYFKMSYEKIDGWRNELVAGKKILSVREKQKLRNKITALENRMKTKK